jgi:hypothetical protein
MKKANNVHKIFSGLKGFIYYCFNGRGNDLYEVPYFEDHNEGFEQGYGYGYGYLEKWNSMSGEGYGFGAKELNTSALTIEEANE